MTTQWIKLEDMRPEEKGNYIVIWANPYYTKDKMSLGIQYFNGKHFNNEKAGANYIAFWLEDLEMPYLSTEERNKFVEIPQFDGTLKQLDKLKL